jgi:hypothetical protein
MQPPTPSPARPTRPSTRTPLIFLALAALCVIAAGVGGYVAQSHRQTGLPTVEARPAQPPAASAAKPAAVSAAPAASVASSVAGEPAQASDAVEAPSASTTAVETVPATAAPAAATSASLPKRPSAPVEKAAPAPKPSEATAPRTVRVAAAAQAPPIPPARSTEPAPAVEMPSLEPPAVAEAPPAPASPAEPVARPPAKVLVSDTFVLPADSVIGLELEHSVSSETAQLEDRVDARVTRDVKIEGTTVIPAGSRVRGAVTRVENGGRFKERGRIEIRFHTLVLADGETQAIATDTLFREGENVGRRTGARIGASAAGGAIIGAIFGGEKGAAIGAAAGAGAGTAATAAQKPSEARFRAGSVVTVRLRAPVSITVQQ